LFKTAVFGRFFGISFVTGIRGAIAVELADRSSVNLGNSHIDSDSLLAGLDPLLIGVVAEDQQQSVLHTKAHHPQASIIRE
jgi:hypothetical protein